MTRDITFRMRPDGHTEDVRGPAEFVALFTDDFGCPFGLVLPLEKVKPGATFVRTEKTPLTEITVSGRCADTLTTKPVEKRFDMVYVGNARVGKYDCAAFRVTQDQRYEGLESSRKTPYGEFPVAIDSVHVQRERFVYFAWGPGKVVAYDARHHTRATFAVKTPMGDKRFETEAKTRWTMILHDGVEFAEQP